MKNIQWLRKGIQALGIVLTIVGLWLNAPAAMMMIMASTVLGGAFYCGWFCPFGTLQDLVGKLGDFLGIKKFKMPRTIQKYLQASRYIVLVVFTLWTASLSFQILSLDPRNYFNLLLGQRTLEWTMLAVLLAFLLIALFFKRPFCNYFCMEGAKKGLMSGMRPFTIKRNQDSCVNCKKCDKVCPMNIEVSTTHQCRSIQCISCMECIEACPMDDTLTYGVVKYNKGEVVKTVIMLLLAVSLLVLPTVLSGAIEENHAPESQVIATKPVNTEVSKVDETGNQEVSSTDEVITTPSSSHTSSMYNDGVYQGSGQGFKGIIVVEVTIESGLIKSVVVVEERDDARWFNAANNVIPSSVVEAQSGNVDVVSGATYSSQGIIDATKDALNQAKK